MKKFLVLIMLSGLFFINSCLCSGNKNSGNSPDGEAVPASFHYKVDQFGYLPDEEKVAVISQAVEGKFSPDDYVPGDTLQVRTWPDGTVVHTGSPMFWNYATNNNNVDYISGDKGWWFDFTEVKTEGSYYIYDVERDVSSHIFRIAEDVYRDVFIQAARTFYYQRMGCAKEAQYAGDDWADEAVGLSNDTHARYLYDPTNTTLERDVSGGWMDAGDYDKYVTDQDNVICILLTAYQNNPSVWGDDHNIPESGNGVLDIIDEIRYGLEFIKKMQDDDGGVFIKAGDSYGYPQITSPPSAHQYTRYYGRKASASTICTAGIFAHAAYVFKNNIQGLTFTLQQELNDEADILIGLAVKAWDYYHANPKVEDADTPNADGYSIYSADCDRSLGEQEEEAARAAIWLWAVTGDDTYHDYFKDHYYTFTDESAEGEEDRDFMWTHGTIGHEDAVLFYTTLPGADATLSEQIKNDKKGMVILDNGNGTSSPNYYYYRFRESMCLYRGYLGGGLFTWGSNMARAQDGLINMNVVTYDLDTPNADLYTKRALAQIHWFHGVNALGKVMLSNMSEYGAENSVNSFFHTWFQYGTRWSSVLTGIGPPPGYLVGGPNPSARYYYWSQPPSKCYDDINDPSNEVRSWEVTENKNDYQAAYLRLLSCFVNSLP